MRTFEFPIRKFDFQTQYSIPMEFLDPELERYIEAHTSPENETLAALNRETHLKVFQPRMLSGHLQGRVLSMLSKMIKPKNILEIGTYTGYSALCFAEGLSGDGHIDTIDHNEELKPMVESYLKRSGLTDRVTLHVGEASDIIPSLDKMYDIVFIDADKENYIRYYDAVFEKVRPGGYIIADNVLWSGKVIDEKEIEKDLDTKTLVEYNEKLQKDPRVENVLFPIRDGLMIARKKEDRK